MEISLTCPHCGEETLVSLDEAKNLTLCPHCGKPFKETVPQAGKKPQKPQKTQWEQFEDQIAKQDRKIKIIKILAISLLSVGVIAAALGITNSVIDNAECTPEEVLAALGYDYGGDDGSIRIYSADSEELFGDIVIPATIEGVKVTRIEAFSGCDRITSVTIPEGVTSVYGFSSCEKLERVTLPNTLTTIGSSTFSYCYKLTSITIPDSVTTIETQAFYRCTLLSEINGCGGIKNIDSDAFEQTEYLSNEANWENEALYLGSCLFQTKETISGDYTVKDGTTSIAARAFLQRQNLTGVTIPDSVISIGTDAFWDCENLTDVSIGNGVTEIGDSAFGYCLSLTNLVLGSGVKSLENSFGACESLQNLYYYGAQTAWSEVYVPQWNFPNMTVYYYDGSATETSAGSYWHYDGNGEIVAYQR